jgi:hypothetical protein
MATGTITDKINNVVALLIDQCSCETPSEIKAAFGELQAALQLVMSVSQTAEKCRDGKHSALFVRAVLALSRARTSSVSGDRRPAVRRDLRARAKKSPLRHPRFP